MMGAGTMEVTVVGARDLKNTEFFGRVDPYVVIQYKNEEQKSTTGRRKASKSRLKCCVCLRGQGGRRAEWNQKFKFKVELGKEEPQQQHKLLLKIMDHDNFTLDDCLGQTTIYLNALLEVGLEKGTAEIPVQKYRVVSADKTYRGEIQAGITFTTTGASHDQQEFGGHVHGMKAKAS